MQTQVNINAAQVTRKLAGLLTDLTHGSDVGLVICDPPHYPITAKGGHGSAHKPVSGGMLVGIYESVVEAFEHSSRGCIFVTSLPDGADWPPPGLDGQDQLQFLVQAVRTLQPWPYLQCIVNVYCHGHVILLEANRPPDRSGVRLLKTPGSIGGPAFKDPRVDRGSGYTSPIPAFY